MNIFSLGAPSWFWEVINGLWLTICRVIFIFINYLYRVFVKIASVNLFSTEVFERITGNLYVVMGIAMLFVFAYNLILMIIDPDNKKSTGGTTKIVKETIISLVIIVLLPTIFNYLFIFQDRLLSTNIIGRIIMGNVGNVANDTSNCDPGDFDCSCDFSEFEELNDYNGYHNGWVFKYEEDTDEDELDTITTKCKEYNSDKYTDSERGAFSIAPTIFSAFYRPNKFDYNDCVDYLTGVDDSVITEEKDQKICVNFFYDVTMSKYTGNIGPFVNDDYLSAIVSDGDDDSMVFDWLWAIIAGGLAVWMFLCYAMEIGVRVAKLGLLQIISPIPVMMRIVPGQKEKMYDKWFNQLKNTYLDVFIRLAIIYFSLFAISLVPDVIATMWKSNWNGTSGIDDFFIRTLSIVVIILGILKFAQEAPALIKEFFGDTGRFALKSPSKQLRENKLAMGGLGLAGGGVSSMLGNFSKGYNKGDGFWKNAANIAKKTPSGIGGLIGGARRGAQYGFGATNLENLKYGIQRAKSESDAARDKHATTRQKGLIKGKEILGVSSVVGGYKETIGDISKDFTEFKTFIAGKASNERAAAGREVLGKFEATESQFKNATINNIENAQQKATAPYYAGQPVELNDEVYKKFWDSSKEAWYWKGTTGKDTEVRTHEDMGKYINNHFDNEKRNAYSENYKKNMEALQTHMNASMETLSKNISKMGESFSRKLFTTLNDPEGLSLNVNNVDQLSEKIGSLMSDAMSSSDTSGDSRKILYDINDTLKKQSKGFVGENAPLERKDKK